jgi:casein kinase II subunit alpha
MKTPSFLIHDSALLSSKLFPLGICRRDNVDQLRQIASALGGKDLLKYCNRINVTLSPELKEAVVDYQHRKPWSSFISHGCPIPDQYAFDLLDKLLVYDHSKRLTAAEAMNHSFFDDVRCKDR